MIAYYNEVDPYAAQWLRNLAAAGHIAAGVVDERSIAEVQPSDLLVAVERNAARPFRKLSIGLPINLEIWKLALGVAEQD